MIRTNLLLAGDDGYNLTKSLRFRSSASAYLNRTFGTPTSATTWTISTWVKRGQLGTEQVLFGVFNSGTDYFYFGFDGSTDRLQIFDRPSGGGTNWLTTTQVFRDPSAWYHIVYVFDTTQATSTNRQKLYINGVQVTSFATQTPGTQNSVARWNASGNVSYIGRSGNSGGQAYIDMYQAELNFIDGQALTPSSFGSTNALTGVWQPTKYTGTYGTNGFYLPFTNTTSTSTLGNDFSGNSNTWTVNNISLTTGSTYDSMTDVPTLTSATVANYAVFNPINVSGGGTTTITNGNLAASAGSTTTFAKILGSIGMSSGKWYWEVTVTAVGSIAVVGIGDGTPPNGSTSLGGVAGEVSYLSSGNKYTNAVSSAYGSSYTTNDVIGVAYDADAGSITFYKNNTSQGAITGFSGTKYAGVSAGGGTNPQYAINFGQQPFSYTPPTGFVALNTFNLPTSTIVKGNTVMDATTYTGNGGATQTITNTAGFKPDLVWIKDRSNARNNDLLDSIRGPTTGLFSNLTNSEVTSGYLSSFNSNGFTTGNDVSTNGSGETFVGWQWQAGQGSSSSNTSGSITSTVSVNASAGFSVVTYTGNGTLNATIGHGLGVAPSMVIIKNRVGANNWDIYHISNGAQKYMDFTTAGVGSLSTIFPTTPTSSVMYLGTTGGQNTNATNYVAYCFAAVSGYSAFGSYTGNGSTDGTFVYTGFRPKLIMVKRTDSAGNWYIYDSSRDAYNAVTQSLYPNLSNAESNDGATYDFLSNGFKNRRAGADQNASGGTYIYMAFAENPFKNSLAR